MFKKPNKNPKGLWRDFYIQQAKKYWYIYLLGILSVMLTNITEIFVPKLFQWTVDFVSGSQDKVPDFIYGSESPLFILGVLLAVNTLVAFFTRAGWRQFLGKRTHYAARKIRKDLWRNLSKQNLTVFNNHPMGDLINRSITDINPARFIFGFTIVMSSDIVFFCLFGMAMMFHISPLIASVVMSVFFILPLLVFPIIRKEYQLHETAQESLSVLSDTISQMLASVRLQRITGMEQSWSARLSEESSDYAAKQFELERTAWNVFPISNVIVVIAYAVILAVGINELNNDALTAGEFVALVSLVSLVSGPVVEIASNLLEWQKGISSLDRICELVELEGDVVTGPSAAVFNSDAPEIDIKNLSFSFGVQQESLLKGLDFSLKSGASLGITGKVGTGKSTLINIIAGIQKVPRGKVFIKGIDITQLSRKDITAQISVVPQTPFLFAGSIRENLNLDKDFPDEILWKVLDDVCLKNDFYFLANQLDTQIGEWGISLSGGQKQRLALARNLLRPKPIMLFDDCLSAVDTKTEAKIQTVITEKSVDKALVWVAHRHSTIKQCDRVVELVAGRFKDVR